MMCEGYSFFSDDVETSSKTVNHVKPHSVCLECCFGMQTHEYEIVPKDVAKKIKREWFRKVKV
jgi:hypothetical protein